MRLVEVLGKLESCPDVELMLYGTMRVTGLEVVSNDNEITLTFMTDGTPKVYPTVRSVAEILNPFKSGSGTDDQKIVLFEKEGYTRLLCADTEGKVGLYPRYTPGDIG